MSFRYSMQVVNINTHLLIRSGPGTQYPIMGRWNNGDQFIADGSQVVGSNTWYHIENTNNYSCGNASSGTPYLRIIADLTQNPPAPVAPSPAPAPEPQPKKATTIRATNVTNTINDLNTGAKLGVPKSTGSNANSKEKSAPSYEGYDKTVGKTTKDKDTETAFMKKQAHFIRITSAKYPKVTTYSNGTYKVNYDFTIKKNIRDSVKAIKKNLNIPTAFGRNTLNRYNHRQFNRFRMEFPDIYLRTTTAVVFFTRPDINIFSGSGSNINTQIRNDDRDYYILLKDRDIGRGLTETGGGHSAFKSHNFNPLLSNMAQSLEVQDDAVDTVEMGETFTGYKMQYSKHNIKSITAGQLNIKFKETFDLAITNTHQLWVDYQSNVYKGIFTPKRAHIWQKELDYACNIYYFLLDQDGESIKFWSKYYGCFPVNVPKSSFSFDAGSQVSFPELQVTYNYIYKSDLAPRTIIEFNNDGGNNANKFKYMPVYSSKLDHSYRTWAGIPYVDSFTYKTGINNPNSSDKSTQGYKLRYREPI